MDTERALAFLRAHQPMPPDGEISREDADTFWAILKHFEAVGDERCIPLLIGSVSTDTGLGMYEYIGDVLLNYGRAAVVPHLRRGLLDGNEGARFRCCWWAADLRAWELAAEIQPLTNNTLDDIRDAAQAFINIRDTEASV